jgi:hypothetical protein
MADPVEPPVPPAPAPNPNVPHVDPEPDSKAWTKLNREKAQHLARANEAEQKLATIQAERDSLATAKAELEAKHATEAAEVVRLRGSVKQVATAASLKIAAIQAGIVDLDALKLIDAATLDVDDAGELKDGAAVMAKLKAEKPYLFGSSAPPAPRTTTGNPSPTPPPAPASKKPALNMTDDEFNAALKTGAWRK